MTIYRCTGALVGRRVCPRTGRLRRVLCVRLCLHDLACAALGADVIDIRADVAPDMSGQPRAWWTARELRGRRVASGRVDSLPLRAAGYVAALEAATEAER